MNVYTETRKIDQSILCGQLDKYVRGRHAKKNIFFFKWNGGGV